MSDTILPKTGRKSAANYEARAVEMLAEINHLEEQMDKDYAESERLKIETQIIKAHTQTTLTQLQEQINRLSSVG